MSREVFFQVPALGTRSALPAHPVQAQSSRSDHKGVESDSLRRGLSPSFDSAWSYFSHAASSAGRSSRARLRKRLWSRVES